MKWITKDVAIILPTNAISIFLLGLMDPFVLYVYKYVDEFGGVACIEIKFKTRVHTAEKNTTSRLKKKIATNITCNTCSCHSSQWSMFHRIINIHSYPNILRSLSVCPHLIMHTFIHIRVFLYLYIHNSADYNEYNSCLSHVALANTYLYM